MSLPRLEIKTNGLNKFTRLSYSLPMVIMKSYGSRIFRECCEDAVISHRHELIFIDIAQLTRLTKLLKNFQRTIRGYTCSQTDKQGNRILFLRAVKAPRTTLFLADGRLVL